MEPARASHERPLLPGESWTPPTNLAARLLFTFVRRIHDHQLWRWRGAIDEPDISLLFPIAIPQGLNALTVLGLIFPGDSLDTALGPGATYAAFLLVFALPVALEMWWLREPGRMHVVIWEADTYRRLSGPLGTALLVAYFAGSVVLFLALTTPAT